MTDREQRVIDQAIDNMGFMLEEYASMKKGWQAGTMLDELLVLKKDLMINKEASEGMRIGEIGLLFSPGEPPISVGDTRVFESPLTNKMYAVEVYEIKGMAWNEDGSLRVSVLGIKRAHIEKKLPRSESIWEGDK